MHRSEHENRPFTIKRKSFLTLFFLIFILHFGCKDDQQPVRSTFVSIVPTYGNTRIIAHLDTLHFGIREDAYNDIKSFNYFREKDSSYISFYDRRSESITIYSFKSRHPVKQIRLKKRLKDKRFYKTSVYTHNFDSIFVTNLDKLYLLDSAGKIKQHTTFLGEIESMACLEIPMPVVIKNNIVYTGVRAFVKETSLSAIKNWKVLCGFDLQHENHQLHYLLPDIYRKGLYGRRFLEYSYCYNEKGNFVFSFPADTNIYETNLTDCHNVYYAKSKFQQNTVEPVNKSALENDEGRKEYTLRDSYGPIYYDPYTKRYLRIARQRVTLAAYESKNYSRSYSIIVMNQHFKIIGEFTFNNDFALDTIFFTPDGGIYARVNEKDEQALHFVHLAWNEEPNDSTALTKK